jgi:hypothetical protein
MIRFLLLIISLASFAYSGKQLLSYWNYQTQLGDVQELLYDQVSADQLNEKIGKAINEDRLEDAKTYLAIGKLYHYPLHYDYYDSFIQQRDTKERRIKKSISSFSSGFMSGEGSDASAITGAVVSDLTVIGDVRDLYHQYQLHSKGGEVNRLIIGLSGVGIGLTAATYGTAGTALSAKAGASVFKLAAKTGRLTKSFSSELLKMSKKAFDWDIFSRSIKQSTKFTDIRRIAQQSFHPSALKPLKGMAKNVSIIRSNTSLADTLHMMHYVENSDDLRRLGKFTEKNKGLSKGILSLVGRGAMRSVRVLKKSVQLFLSLAGTIVSALFSLIFMFSRKRSKTEVGYL